MTSIEKILKHTGFRGLWISNRTEKVAGKLIVEKGWSCSFIKDGKYHDLYYSKTPEEACKKALEMLEEINPSIGLKVPDEGLEKIRKEKQLAYKQKVNNVK